MKFYLLSDNVDTLTGMRLAGIEGEVLHEKDEFRAAFDKALANSENGNIAHYGKARQSLSRIRCQTKSGEQNAARCRASRPSRFGKTR